MRELSLIIVFFVMLFSRSSDSPHGDKLDISCDACHTSDSWKVDRKNITFDHSQTGFPLAGTHQELNCLECHPTLVFSEAQPECMSCHTDMHEQTVGFDCSRCHNTTSWIVDNVIDLHRNSRFPLLGAHATADCYDCHQTGSLLRFDPVGVNCIDCHQDTYLATTSPNHVEAGYSTDCSQCHQMNAFAWVGSDFTHSFFPLTEGHNIADCNRCHTDPNDFGNISSDCISCHQDDYNSAAQPNHLQAGLSTNCVECHSTAPGWKPASFREHDNLYFPIYSGEHAGEWASCTDCHTVPDNYALFSCIDCHEHNKGDMDSEHSGVGGYVYESTACLSCHPTGGGDDAINHNAFFPLTGGHTQVECATCHTDGYQGTPSACDACHDADYQRTTNPDHQQIGLGTDCESCHTTNLNWEPATLSNHNDFYALNGAHTSIDCASCHEGNYNSTPNTCYGCHQSDYEQTNDPSHVSAQFPTECTECHSESAWEPSTFNHDGEYFPIYSGEHKGEWSSCTDCHTTPGNYGLFSCIDCHEHNKPDMDSEHSGVGGYVYESTACLDCHPTGGGGDFNKSHSPFNIR